MLVRDRIREFRRVRASELRPNPKNWRTHPSAQQDALRALLAEIGYVGALLARELDDGTLMLIDGHLRAETTPDTDVPVLVLDVDEEEADKILASFDPLSAKAEADEQKLAELLEEVRTESPALRAMLDELAAQHGIGGDDEPAGEEEPPASNYREQYGVIVICDGEQHQAEVYQRLMEMGFNVKVVVT